MNRRLSRESSSEPGQWKTSRAPYQREILDAVCDPKTENVVVMSSAQVGKTELILNILGYYIDYDPSPILIMQPTGEMAMAFSKDRVAKMIRDTPILNDKMAGVQAKRSENTILHKSFPGGVLSIIGSNSPSQLASRPIRILLADEVDRFPPSAGTEGDPLNLAKKRTTTFWNKKHIIVSTPTIKGASRIELAYDDSTQEQYCLPCPDCGSHQPLRWRNIVFEVCGHTCESCGAVNNQMAWLKNAGVWVAQKAHEKTRGFHLNELVSPWRQWEDIIADFQEAKKTPETLKTFINTSLGETWEPEGDTVNDAMLFARREHYKAVVPQKACVITAAVDLQDDRLEIGIEAWGEFEENFKIDFIVLRGDPARPALWAKLDEVLSRRYEHESGISLGIAATMIDSGGHYSTQAYKFVKPRESRRIYAIRGKGGAGVPIVSRPSKSNLGKVNLFSVGVDTAKELIYARLKVSDPGPGYVHFPVAPLFDEEYFAQLTAERCVTKYTKGRPTRVWEKRRKRNEALDIAVYNLAALQLLNPDFKRLSAKLSNEPEQQEKNPSFVDQAQTERKKVKKGVGRKRRGFTNSWR